MKLVIINGSPRGKKSNSKVIADWIISGLVNKIEVEEYYAIQIQKHQEAISSIEDGDTILLVFPLYTDSVPGVTKLFIEELDSIKDEVKDIKIYYIVQSGFAGAMHSRAVERYLTYVAKHMGFKYLGTAIKPSAEGLRLMPAILTKNVSDNFKKLSKDILESRNFNQEVLIDLAGFEVPPLKYRKHIEKGKGGKTYFNSLLRKHKAYPKRFDQPYVKK